MFTFDFVVHTLSVFRSLLNSLLSRIALKRNCTASGWLTRQKFSTRDYLSSACFVFRFFSFDFFHFHGSSSSSSFDFNSATESMERSEKKTYCMWTSNAHTFHILVLRNESIPFFIRKLISLLSFSVWYFSFRLTAFHITPKFVWIRAQFCS